MHRYRVDIGDGLTVDPCSGQSSGAVAGVTESNRGAWPYTPDVIAVPLVQGAIQFISQCAVDLLRAREMYAKEIETQQRRGCSAEVWRKSAIRVLQQVTLDTPKGPHTIKSGADLAELLDVLYTACFIVISYLVGPRASEILQLQSGCLQPFGADDSGGDTPVAMIVGAIFKREAAYHGRHHRWVAPSPAAHAITVLEALSVPHRARSGRREIWLRSRGGGHTFGATEWQHSCSSSLQVMSTGQMGLLLRRCSTWFELPLHEGKLWRFRPTRAGRPSFVLRPFGIVRRCSHWRST